MPIEEKLLKELLIAIAIFAALVILGVRRASSNGKRQEPKAPPELPGSIVFNSFSGAPTSDTAWRFATAYWRITGGLRERLRRLAKLLHSK